MSIDYQRLERNLAREFRQYHVAAQVYRVAGVFLGLLTAQLATGWHDWTWKGLIALLAAAGYGALRQVFPTVPWKTFLGHVQLAQTAAELKDGGASVGTQATAPAAAEHVYTPVTKPTIEPPGNHPATDPAP